MKLTTIALAAVAAVATFTGDANASPGGFRTSSNRRRLGLRDRWNAGWAKHVAAGGGGPRDWATWANLPLDQIEDDDDDDVEQVGQRAGCAPFNC